MPVPLLDLKRQYELIRAEVAQAIQAVLDRQEFILGPAVEAFERAAALYLGLPEAVGVASGTDALILALAALDVGPGDDVVTTPFTFFATAGAIARVGARPVFADIDPETFNVDPAALERAGTGKTRAVIVVHLFGRCAPMGPILDFARRRGLFVIEDAAQAFGASQAGRKAGTFGHLAAFSFFPSKNLGGCGDGGLIATAKPDLAARLRSIRIHGAVPENRYLHREVGFNSRLDALQAAVLGVKLRRIDEWNRLRQVKALFYNQALASVPAVRTPNAAGVAEHIYHQYVIRAERRDGLARHLKERGVGHAVYYPLPLHLQEAFRSLGHREGAFPESERAAREVLALPIFPELTDAEQEEVVGAVREFYDR